MATMHVEVVSAERHVLSADVTELYARSVEGEIGILPGHQPALDVGVVSGGCRVRVRAVGGQKSAQLLVDVVQLAGELLLLGEDALLDLLDEALRARVIEEAAVPGEYRFTHALMQETLLGAVRHARLEFASDDRYAAPGNGDDSGQLDYRETAASLVTCPSSGRTGIGCVDAAIG